MCWCAWERNIYTYIEIHRDIALFIYLCEIIKETPAPCCYNVTVSSPVEVGANNVGIRERVRI